MNSSIKTRLQDSFLAIRSYSKPHEYFYTTFSRSTASEISIPSQTTANQGVTELFNKRIIIFGSISCAVIVLIALISFLIVCMLGRKSRSRPSTTFSPSNHDVDVSVRQRNIDSLNNPRLKPLYLLQTHKLKPLHLVIKHRDTLDKKEKLRIANQQEGIIQKNNFQQKFDTRQQDGLIQQYSRQRENNLLENIHGQGMKDERNIREKLNNLVKIIERKNVEIFEGNDSSIDDDIYEDLTIYDIIEMFKTLNGDYNYVNYINE
ncbi:14_t:CDS:2 [Funneliformis geosporum]|uniref:14_t:CDS:1 n=1 Tax=Funneliformis geosporum TaxID=1117311 RepID=A0A9W4SFH0_9GLOM|nr:14_t:CDS:2 [Funneliformis geosporum]